MADSTSSNPHLSPPPEAAAPPAEAAEVEAPMETDPGNISKRRGKRPAKAKGRRGRPPLPPRDILPDLNFPACDNGKPGEGMRFLLQKELRSSDVNDTGRIVLPKKEAEAHLPILASKEGFTLPMIDMLTAKQWSFKYRYWPNNKSRMYILEHAGEFIKAHNLQFGDHILIYKDESKNRYVIRAKKESSTEPVAPVEDEIFGSIEPDIVVASVNYSDLYYPLDDGTNMPFGPNSAFSPDFPIGFPNENVPNASSAGSVEPFPGLGSIESLFLQDFP